MNNGGGYDPRRGGGGHGGGGGYPPPPAAGGYGGPGPGPGGIDLQGIMNTVNGGQSGQYGHPPGPPGAYAPGPPGPPGPGYDDRYARGGGSGGPGGGASGAPMGAMGAMGGRPNVGSYRDGPALPPPSFASRPVGGGGLPLAGAGVAGGGEEVMCPSECAGKVIGHGGETINSIQTKSGAHVKIQSSHEVPPGAPRRITITGAPGPVADAVQMVNDIIREHGGARAGGGGGGAGGGTVEMPVPVDMNMIGRVIGRGGETIRRLADESGARLQIERDQGRVLIRGTQEQCVRAKELVLDVLNDPNPAGAAGGGFAKHVMAAQGCEGKIIGKGGETIRELCARTGAKIQIDKEDASVTIQGRQEQVDAAVAAVQAIIDEGPNYGRPGGGGGGGYGGYGDAGGAGGYGDAGAAAGGPKPLWETHQSPEGYTYYYNTVTGETQWDQPDDFPGVRPDDAP